MQLTWQDRGQPQGAVGLGVPPQPSPMGTGEWGGLGRTLGMGKHGAGARGRLGGSVMGVL